MKREYGLFFAMAAVVFLLLPGRAPAGDSSRRAELSKGGHVYVSIYSNVFAGPKKTPFQLAAIVVVRNTDPGRPLTILTADYYDSEGRKVRSYIEKPVEVAPLATVYYFVEERDTAGGVGANFLVRWEAAREVNVPIIEGVMTGGRSGQGISFITPGQYILDQGD